MKCSTLVLLLILVFTGFCESLSLKEYEKRVLSKGYQTTIDSLDNVARKWQKRNVVAEYLPSVVFNASVTGISKEAQEGQMGALSDFPGVTFSDTSIISYDFTLNQPLINGGIEIVAIKIAELTKKAQEIGYDINRDNAVVAARKRYFGLIKLEEQIILAKDDLKWAQEKLQEAEIRYETNSIPQTDLLQWQSSVLSKESSLATLESMRENFYAEFASSMGEFYSSGKIYTIDSFSQFEQLYNELQIEEVDISKSKLLTQMDLYHEVTKRNKTVALTNALPKLNGFITYSRTRYKDEDNYRGGLQGGVQLSVPIFSGFRNGTAYKEKVLEAEKSEIELQKLKSEIMQSVIQLRNYCITAKGTIKSINKQHVLNKKNVEILNERYQMGQVSQSDLISMKNSVSVTRYEYVTNILDMLYYYAEYQNVLGLLEVQ